MTTTNERCPDCGRLKLTNETVLVPNVCMKGSAVAANWAKEDCAAHKARASTDKKPVCARCNDTGEIACYPDDAPCPACWKAGRINPNADARASVQDAGAPSGKERFVIEWLTDLAQQLGNGCDGDTARAALDLVKEALQHRADSPAVSAQVPTAFLSDADMADLTTFYDQLNDFDADGFTLTPESRERLTEIGCIYKSGRNLWTPTSFGAWLVECAFSQNPELPLSTTQEFNSRATTKHPSDNEGENDE
jgi:hypothetical protein